MFIKMEQATARGLEGANKSKTPAAAMNHLLTVLHPPLQSKMGVRSEDLSSRVGFDGHWPDGPRSSRPKSTGESPREGDVRRPLELSAVPRTPASQAEHLERDEELYLNREFMTDMKLKGHDRGAKGRGGRESQRGKGRGKDEQRGDKGKGQKKEKEKDRRTIS